MKRGLAILLVASLAANVFLGGFVAGRFFAGPQHKMGAHPSEMSRGFRWRMAHDFEDLSPEAREAFRSVFTGGRERLRENYAETRRLRAALGEALAADEWNRADVEAALAALRAAEGEQHAATAALMIEAFEGLSAEDRKALVKAMDHRGDRRRMRMRHGPGGDDAGNHPPGDRGPPPGE